jgi:integrase
MLRVSPSRADDAARPVEMTDDPRAPLFPEVAGKAGPGRNGLSMTFKQMMLAAGIENAREQAGRSLSALSFHSLRHSFNSALANAGVSQELRQKVTGHASAAIDSQCTHHEMETLRRAVEAIPRLPTEDMNND